METVVLIIMLMVSLSFMLKLTWHSPVGAAVTAALAALFVFFAQDAATAQSKTRIADVLADPALMLDISVVLTVDVAFQLLFCFLKARSLGGPLPRGAKAVAAVCLWVPGLLIFPVLFALLVEIIFSMPGADFTLVAASTAAAAAAGSLLLAYGAKALIPEDDMRLELLFLVNVIIAALGIVATVNGRTSATPCGEVDAAALAATAALALAGAAAGCVIYRFIETKKISKIK